MACFAGSNGAISLTVTGGTASYSYAWNDGLTTPNRTNLDAGSYIVTVTDNNGCTSTTSATITQPATALSVSTTTQNINCFGGNNGSISLTVSGGTLPYTYTWNDGSTLQNRAALVTGTYSVTITDNHNCTTSTSVTLTQPAAALAVVVSTTNVSCFGGNNGSVSLNVTGGTAPYSYNWSGGATTQNRANLTSGNYPVTIADLNSCSVSVVAAITEPTILIASISSQTNVACFAGSNGAISLTVTGGTASYSYAWNDGLTTPNRTNLDAGSYIVTVTDNNGCSSTASTTIIQPAAALSVSAAAQNINCFGGNNGSISLTVSGGAAPYSYKWSDGSTTPGKTGLSSGTYYVTVTDAHSCASATSAIITQPSTALSVSISASNVSCFAGSNGTAKVSVTGGTIPYSYIWTSGAKSSSLSNLSAGSYSVTVFDNLGCTITATVQIMQPAVLNATAQTGNVACHGSNTGYIQLTVRGGVPSYRYKWSNGSNSNGLQNLIAGDYIVTVADANNCTTTNSSTVTEPQVLQVSAGTTNVLCYGDVTGAIHPAVSGGVTNYKYQWNNLSSSPSISDIPAGTYSLTVTDANSCTVSVTKTITQPAAIAVTETHTNEPCHGLSVADIDITVTGGAGNYSYAWNNSSTSENLNNIKAGYYNLTVTDANSCTAIKQITISEPASVAVSEKQTNPSCNGWKNGSIGLTVSGGCYAAINICGTQAIPGRTFPILRQGCILFQ